jgi:hypothetical protein
MKHIDSYWFGLIGIVKIHNGFETKWYIGTGLGKDEAADADHIAKTGQPFHPDSMKYFLQPVQWDRKGPDARFDSDEKTYM